ncbi:MAG: hypothetical protein WDZ85_02715 [Candidatus Paceibacterota bacterium]
MSHKMTIENYQQQMEMLEDLFAINILLSDQCRCEGVVGENSHEWIARSCAAKMEILKREAISEASCTVGAQRRRWVEVGVIPETEVAIIEVDPNEYQDPIEVSGVRPLIFNKGSSRMLREGYGSPFDCDSYD